MSPFETTAELTTETIQEQWQAQHSTDDSKNNEVSIMSDMTSEDGDSPRQLLLFSKTDGYRRISIDEAASRIHARANVDESEVIRTDDRPSITTSLENVHAAHSLSTRGAC